MHLKTFEYPGPRLAPEHPKNRKQKHAVEIAEFGFSPIRHENGYIVVMAAIVVPAANLVIFGASCCSPEDIYDGTFGAKKAAWRARQNAASILVGETQCGSLTDAFLPSIPTPREGCTIAEVRSDTTAALIAETRLFKRLVDKAAKQARHECVRKAVKSLGISHGEISAMMLNEEILKAGATLTGAVVAH